MRCILPSLSMAQRQDPVATPPKVNITDARLRPQIPPQGSLHLPVPGSWADVGSPALEVTGARGQQHIVGVPVQAEDRGANGLLDVLAHPPGHTEGRGTGSFSTPGTLHSHAALQTPKVPRGRGLDQAGRVLGALQVGTPSLVSLKLHDNPGTGSVTQQLIGQGRIRFQVSQIPA